MALNPSHPGWYQFPAAWSHWWKGEYDRALAEATKINQPDLFWTYVTFLRIHGATGQTREVSEHLAQLHDPIWTFRRRCTKNGGSGTYPKHA